MALQITWTDVSNIATELTVLPVDAQTIVLSLVDEQLDALTWGSRLKAGQLYLSAHYGSLALNGGGGPGGVVESDQVGQINQKYSVPMNKNNYDMTIYGRVFNLLVKSLHTTRMSVVGIDHVATWPVSLVGWPWNWP